MLPAWAVGLALGLTKAQAVTSPSLPFELELEPCVEVEREELLQLLSVELSGAGQEAETGLRIEVSCTSEPEIVRLTERRGASVTTRELDLRAAGQAARSARARELSLLIAESVKSRESAPVSTPSRVAAKPPPPPPERVKPWLELGLAGGAEKYAGGYAQLGPTGSARLLLLSPVLFEARFGARWAQDVLAPAGPVSTRAWLLAAGVGLDMLPRERAAGLSLLARFECDWLFAEGRASEPQTQGLGDVGRAYVLSFASSAWLRLGEGVRVVAEPALVLPLRGLEFHDRGRTVAGISGVGAAASLGLSLRL